MNVPSGRVGLPVTSSMAPAGDGGIGSEPARVGPAGGDGGGGGGGGGWRGGFGGFGGVVVVGGLDGEGRGLFGEFYPELCEGELTFDDGGLGCDCLQYAWAINSSTTDSRESHNRSQPTRWLLWTGNCRRALEYRDPVGGLFDYKIDTGYQGDKNCALRGVERYCCVGDVVCCSPQQITGQQDGIERCCVALVICHSVVDSERSERSNSADVETCFAQRPLVAVEGFYVVQQEPVGLVGQQRSDTDVGEFLGCEVLEGNVVGSDLETEVAVVDRSYTQVFTRAVLGAQMESGIWFACF